MNSRIVWLLVCMVWGIFSSCNTDRERKIDYTRYVNPFVGNADNGHTFPGACTPFGLIQVSPESGNGSWRYCSGFNYDDDSIAGFSQTHLNGTGVPDLGDIRMLPFNQNLQGERFFCRYERETQVAMPGYYSVKLADMNIDVELTATERTAMHRYTFNQPGEANLLLDLQNGLVFDSKNVRYRVLEGEVEMLDNKTIAGYNRVRGWVARYFYYMIVFDRPYTVKKELPQEEGEKAKRFILEFDLKEGESVQVKVALSTVGIEGAKMALDKENPGWNFESIKAETNGKWNDMLSLVEVEGTEEEKMNFYTSMYHLFIQPTNIADIDGKYRGANDSIFVSSTGYYYSTFSLWDTYRNVHQLLTLVYPERQMEMVRTMLDMYREHGWFPKWELYGRETLTMEGDPSIPVIVDTWMKGLRDFDVDLAYEAMYKSATLPGAENLMRPDNDDYMSKGYVPLREQYDNSVSHALEYYIADFALSRFADALGKKKDAEMFYKRSLGYKHYYSKEFGTFRPILPDGTFYSPFNPRQGENFEPNPGFHEGNSWNYTFYVPHDVYGLAKLMGGKKPFVNKLQMVFDEGLYDPANEPDIAYAHLFSYFKGEEWRTQKETQRLLDKYFTTKPDGIPGNDDTGTMSAWAIFNMIGFYPDCPGLPEYTLTTPVFNKVTIRLDPKWYKENELVIESNRTGSETLYINKVLLDGKKFNKYRITHDELVHGKRLIFDLK